MTRLAKDLNLKIRMELIPKLILMTALKNLVWRPGTDWLAVDIHVGLLPQVKPDDGAVLGVDRSGDLLEDILDALECRLASGVDLVAGDPVEVRGTRQRVGQLLHLVELVGHGRSH